MVVLVGPGVSSYNRNDSHSEAFEVPKTATQIAMETFPENTAPVLDSKYGTPTVNKI